MTQVETDISVLKGDSLEVKLYRRIRPLLCQRLNLRKAQIMQSLVQETKAEFYEAVEEALDSDVITDDQETRIDETDIVFRAQCKDDRSPVWVAVEVSNHISQSDIERVHQSAHALRDVFQQDAVAVAAGYRIHATDQKRANNADVYILLIEESG